MVADLRSGSRPRLPYFPFYPRDWSADPDVQAMSAEERGAYISLLCAQWEEEGLRRDPEWLAALCRVRSERWLFVWKRLSRKFVLGEDGLLRNPRLQREREAVEERSGKARGAARSRWGGEEMRTQSGRNADAMRPHPPSICSGDARAMPIQNPEPRTHKQQPKKAAERPPSKEEEEALSRILSHFQERQPTRKITQAGKRKALARLREGSSAQELVEAIEGNACSIWHQDRGLCSLAWILDSERRVEEMRARLDAGGRRRLSEASRGTQSTVAELLAELPEDDR